MTQMKKQPGKYNSGPDRYINFATDFIGLQLAEVQKKMLRSVEKNQRTLIWGANGPGKSYVTAALKLGFLYTNPDSIVLGTSGSYQQYEDTMWRPLEDMHSKLKEKHGLPGQTKGGNRPRLELDSEWYAKIISPREPGELEGRHNEDVLVVIDEADKKYVTEEHFSSAGSSITDLNDKLVAICNPPKDEENVVKKKKDSQRWNVLEFSAFDSHNAQVDAGIINEPKIPGLVDLMTIAEDYEVWNKRQWPLAEKNYPHGEWPGITHVKDRIDDPNDSLQYDEALDWVAPGFNVAKEAHKRWDTLDVQWYIRRAGVMPPTGAETHRPIEPEDVRAAWQRSPPESESTHPKAVGIDVARSGDKTVMIGEHNGVLRVHYSERGDNHETQKREVVGGTRTTPPLREWPRAKKAVDKGYAPGFYDYINDRCPNVFPFQNGTKPIEMTRWYNKWAEALYHMGEWLENGGVIEDADLREELNVASRVVTFEARTLDSRGRNGAEVYKATPKEDIKEEINHSPDFLDAALMAIWRLRTNVKPTSTQSTWYDPYQEA